MSIKKEYFDLLTHLGSTSTVAELCASKQGDNIIALRHDVDHDLELALEMAHHEWRLGFKATYYLLHTEKYWNDPKFPLLVRQLKEYGHEVGLHINTLTQWMRAEIDNVELEIEGALAHVRACGIEVTGVCAHGDKLCYEKGFVNYWLWNELRADDPINSENGISAEGIYVDDPAYQIPYPLNHELVRENGTTFPLWSVSMEKHGIKYDAAKLQQEKYWSDSGGSWERSDDPMEGDFSQGRHQVLVHPWWWRGEPKKIFIMSPARSGSKWLANYIDKATSAVGLHEWTLNHVRECEEFPLDNRTTREFVALLDDVPEISSRLRAAKAHHTLFKKDVVECNVYVESVAKMLQTNIPDAEVLHLKREPTDIVRSILNRGWYEVTQDHKHRSDGSEKWNSSNQLERACRYVRSANENIAEITTKTISFKEMISDPDYLPEELSKLGIVVHPLLAKELFNNTVNKNKDKPIPSFAKWKTDDQDFAKNILFGDMSAHKEIKFKVFKKVETPNWKKTNAKNMHVTQSVGSTLLSTIDQNKSSYVVFYGSSWDNSLKAGMRALTDSEYRISIYTKGDSTEGRVFVIGYGETGTTVERLHIARIVGGQELSFVVKPKSGWIDYSIALYFDAQLKHLKLEPIKMSVCNRKQPADYTFELHGHYKDQGQPPRLACLDKSEIVKMQNHFRRKKRYIPSDYEKLLTDYLDTHENITLGQYTLEADLNNRNILLIRHDVDHDFETALAMAKWESDRGIVATYCLLHTAWYWGNLRDGEYSHYQDLVDFGNRLRALGHEISLHNNFVTLGLTDGVNPKDCLLRELRFMNAQGWEVISTTLHGDKLCREYNYNNAELFIEAVKPERGGPREIIGPNGSVLLGTVSYREIGVKYEAYDIARDIYITDSGGRLRCMKHAKGRRNFTRTDPSSGNIVGILTHPVWWDFGAY